MACLLPELYLNPGTTMAIRKVIRATRGSDDNGPGGAMDEFLTVGLEPLINLENHRDESTLVRVASDPFFVSVLVRVVSDETLKSFESCIGEDCETDLFDSWAG
jgi:hypothetical protein